LCACVHSGECACVVSALYYVITKKRLALCNTLGVCHSLSSGFELKHDRLSGDEDIKVKPMEMSPNLNLDIAPLLYI
jgi:hypothetical protein